MCQFDSEALKPSTISPAVLVESSDEDGETAGDGDGQEHPEREFVFTAEEEILLNCQFEEGIDILMKDIKIG